MNAWGALRGGGRADTDGGASLVEFAVVMPLLMVLVLGIIEFGFLLAQMNELRHGAREGARYAAVSRPDVDGNGVVGNKDDVVAATCGAINLPGTTVTVSLSGGTDRLDFGTLTVTADTKSLSGFPFVTSMLPDNLTNEATFRLEQDAAWSPFGDTACAP